MGVKIVSEHKGPKRSSMGLGDVIEVVAKPIAKALGITDCEPCERRKAALNTAGARARSQIRKMFRRSS